MKYDFKKQLRSFGYAWKGIRCCIGKEQNLSFHLIATAVVVIAGFVHEDVRQAVAPLPAWNGKHHLSFVYGGRAAGGHGCGLPPDGQSADIPCGVCCCYACRIFLCTSDLSLL